MNLKDIKARNLTAKAPLLAYTEFTDLHRIKLKYQVIVTHDDFVTHNYDFRLIFATDPAEAGAGINTGMTTSTSSTCSFLRQGNSSDRSSYTTFAVAALPWVLDRGTGEAGASLMQSYHSLLLILFSCQDFSTGRHKGAPRP